MPSSPPAPPVLEPPRWAEDLWNTLSSSSAPLLVTTGISLLLAVLAAWVAHSLTKRRENGRWAKQNTLHALQRATEAFYAARQHYGHLLRIDPWNLMLGFRDDSSPHLTTPRDWTLLEEGLQRVHEALLDVHLSSGKYRKRVHALSDLAETVAEKLDETAYDTSFTTPEGQLRRGGAMKKEMQYFEDAMNAIHTYESAFLLLREDITADLTARWWTRRRYKLGRWWAQRKQVRQAKPEEASTDSFHSANTPEEQESP